MEYRFDELISRISVF